MSPTDFEGLDLGDQGYTGFIAKGLSEGMSGNQILGALQEGGLGIRRQNFYGILGEIRASLGKAGDIANLNPESIPDASLFSVWRQAPEGMNIYQVEVHVVDPEFGTVSLPYSVMSSTQLTVGEAVSQALDAMESNNEKYRQRILGGMLVGLHRAG